MIMAFALQKNFGKIVQGSLRPLTLAVLVPTTKMEWMNKPLTISSWAQTMLLHASLHWPDQADLELWPFAVNHVVFLWNHIPRRDIGLSPIELFSSTSFPSKSHLQRLHVWGCPVFVLDPKKFKMVASCLNGTLVLGLANSWATPRTIQLL